MVLDLKLLLKIHEVKQTFEFASCDGRFIQINETKEGKETNCVPVDYRS